MGTLILARLAHLESHGRDNASSETLPIGDYDRDVAFEMGQKVVCIFQEQGVRSAHIESSDWLSARQTAEMLLGSFVASGVDVHGEIAYKNDWSIERGAVPDYTHGLGFLPVDFEGHARSLIKRTVELDTETGLVVVTTQDGYIGLLNTIFGEDREWREDMVTHIPSTVTV